MDPIRAQHIREENHQVRTSLDNVLAGMTTSANAAMVNRTHRIVHERAKSIKERRSKIRSLWVPLIIFSSLIVGVSCAVWSVFEEYELVASESQVGSYQFVVPLLWLVPVSAAVLAVVWFRQWRADATR